MSQSSHSVYDAWDRCSSMQWYGLFSVAAVGAHALAVNFRVVPHGIPRPVNRRRLDLMDQSCTRRAEVEGKQVVTDRFVPAHSTSAARPCTRTHLFPICA